jgi:proteasome lid subunit RPN8/RPN11
MDIVIHSINNSANQEILTNYNESDFIKGDVRLSDNFSSAENTHKIILNNEVVREIFEFIEWDTGLRSDIRDEQGGILLGKRYYDADQNIHFVIVSKAITAVGAIESSGYLEITHECWSDMHQKKDEHNEETGQNLIIVGWFHTHPNMLSCFMSGTDRNTQNLFFDGDNTYSLVINPQRHLLKAFRAKECYPAQAFLNISEVTFEDV